MRYFLHLSYQGTAYRGWQRQIGITTIQLELETALATVLGTPTSLHGCGRTDAGVHAAQFFAHFSHPQILTDAVVAQLNAVLPPDIRIYACIQVADKAHTQFDALERSYRYFFHTYDDETLTHRSARYYLDRFDVALFKEALALLPEHKDYYSFCHRPKDYKHTLCDIKAATLSINQAQNQFCIEITANRFLRQMIRLLVARLIEVGNGRITLSEFKANLNGQALRFSRPAYPDGLFLSKVHYPYLKAEIKSDIMPTIE